MNHYAMTYREAGALRMRRIEAASRAAALSQAFDIVATLTRVCGFMLSRV